MPESQDTWSKTYVSVKKSTSQALPLSRSISTNVPTNTTTKRFPRPKSVTSVSSSSLSRGVSEHILATTSQSPRPPSPLKISTTFSDPASDILPSFSAHEPTLSKVYGSVLQPKETLPLHSCAICSAVFPPDSTLYPNPSDFSDVKAFLCRQCFTVNGGSKGNCPSCSRPVLALKTEGAFVQSGGKYWHKGCFNCMSCFKNIGNTPMVDLLGRPSCADCFDNCLKRDHPVTPKKNRTSANNSPNVGVRLSSSHRGKSREGSPMIEELEQRLGIVRSRDGTPLSIDSPSKLSISPIDRHSPNREIGHDKKELQYGILSPNTTTLDFTDLSTALFKESSPKQSSRTSDVQSSPSIGSNFPTSTKMTSLCNKCEHPILNPRQGGQFVTVPGIDKNDSPKVYHGDCFKCSLCEMPINDSKEGQASFVLAATGPYHVYVGVTIYVTENDTGILMFLQ